LKEAESYRQEEESKLVESPIVPRIPLNGKSTEKSITNHPDDDGFWDASDENLFQKWDEMLKTTQSTLTRIESSIEDTRRHVQQIDDVLRQNGFSATSMPTSNTMNFSHSHNNANTNNNNNNENGFSTVTLVGLGVLLAWPFVAFSIIESIKKRRLNQN